ncbi:PP0621 family protein [Nitratifractor sp.]
MWLKLLIIGGVLYALYRFAGGRILPGRQSSAAAKAEENAESDEETLVECDRCSTFVVKKEAIFFKGKYYCSPECLEKSK